MIERRSRCNHRFNDYVIVFYDKDRRDLPTSHNQSLYITTNMNVVKLKRVMIDPESSINIIFLLVLDAVGISRDKVVRQPIEESSFRGHRTFTIGFVSLDQTVTKPSFAQVPGN